MGSWSGGDLHAQPARGDDGDTYSGEPAGQQTPAVSLARDARGRVVSVAAGTEARTYGWRADGRLDREDASDGNALLYGYDAAGRRTGYALWDGGAGKYATWGGWGYSAATGKLNGVSTPEDWISQGYDPATGAPLAWFTGAVAAPGYAQTSLRDGLGRVVTVTGSANGLTGHDLAATRTYEYNPKGQRKSLLEESGEKWKYDYNARGEVKEGEKKVGSLSLWGMKRGYQYDAIGNRTELRVNDADKNWFANALNQIVSRNVEGKQAVIGRADAAAQVSATALADPAPDAPEVTMLARGGGTRFGAVIDTKNPGVAKYVKVKVTEQVSGQTAHEWPGHLFVPASPEQFGYDADGSLKQDGRWEYTYDAENRLIATKTREGMLIAGDPLPIERIEYRYDAFGRRTEMKVSVQTGAAWKVTKVTKFAYDGWNLIAEWEQVATLNTQLSPLNLRRTHHWGLDLSGTLQGAGGVGGLVLTRHLGPGASAYSAFPAYDGNGNVVALFETASGKRVAEYEYGPFGEPLRATGPMASANPFRWSTKYTDNETGLVYYGYRYYSPGMGRWLSRDPLQERKARNLYGLVGNKSTARIDYLGWFDLQFDSEFDSSEQQRIRDSFARIESRLKVVAGQIDEELKAIACPPYDPSSKFCCPCYRAMYAELEKLKVLFADMLKGFSDPGYEIEFEEDKLKEGMHADTFTGLLGGAIDPLINLNINGDDDYHGHTNDQLDTDLLHELTHVFGSWGWEWNGLLPTRVHGPGPSKNRGLRNFREVLSGVF